MRCACPMSPAAVQSSERAVCVACGVHCSAVCVGHMTMVHGATQLCACVQYTLPYCNFGYNETLSNTGFSGTGTTGQQRMRPAWPCTCSHSPCHSRTTRTHGGRAHSSLTHSINATFSTAHKRSYGLRPHGICSGPSQVHTAAMCRSQVQPRRALVCLSR